uniref:Ubiquitin carboxyl-terminal hydrolase n=1 Tax=Hirondellea gigas TaxID=1518452 RepID=A0A2P2I4E2_9CRUS
MEKLQKELSRIKLPPSGEAIYKDECIYSFDSPDSDTGVYVCMNTFLGFGRPHVERYSERTGNKVFLHRFWKKRERPITVKNAEPDKKIARLAIGVEGGFNTDDKKKVDYIMTICIIILPDFDIIPYPNPDLPTLVQQCITAMEKADSTVNIVTDINPAPWDGELRSVSRFSETLTQLDNGVKIPPKGWQCSLCCLTDNLWLNLTDGTISCGRRQLDGSGGNNHAIDHYKITDYPLSVKLGTITPQGKADVYSYSEDDMVIDSQLVKHLAHFGINVSLMEKTEKTMAELEIDYNQRMWEYSRLTESSQKLVAIFGPGYTGLHNLGNSCYLNSVVQILFHMPQFVNCYFKKAEELMFSLDPTEVCKDFDAQMAKLSIGLLSGRYSIAPDDFDPHSTEEVNYDELEYGVAPTLFRRLVGKGHIEFSTKKQQDAIEYLEHLVKTIERNCKKTGREDPGHCFKFGVSDKFECSATGCVRYVYRTDIYVPLPINLDDASNKEEVADYTKRKEAAEKSNDKFSEDVVRSIIPFEKCFGRILGAETIKAHSEAANAKVDMERTTRMTSFPDNLFIQLVRFGVTEKWEPVKYDVSVDMPEVLDISALRRGPTPAGEKAMPESTPKADPKPAAPVIDEEIVQQLLEMGFPVEGCRKAVHHTQNSGLDTATNWIMEHMADADFDQPLRLPSSATNDTESASVNPESVVMLESMGFTTAQAKLGLKKTQNNLERAADWLFSHQEELELLLKQEVEGAKNIGPATTAATSTIPRTDYTDGEPKYELAGFISHMGTSVHVGHYVCHIKKEGQWIIYNDAKVCKSVHPPLDLGYLYLYRRVDS